MIPGDSHALASTACAGLDHHRVSDLVGYAGDKGDEHRSRSTTSAIDPPRGHNKQRAARGGGTDLEDLLIVVHLAKVSVNEGWPLVSWGVAAVAEAVERTPGWC